MIAARQTQWYKVKSPLPNVKYLKIAILSKSEDIAPSYVQIGEWEFIDKDGSAKTFSTLPQPIAASLKSDEFLRVDANEDVPQLFDGNVRTKCCKIGGWTGNGFTAPICPLWFVVDLGDETLDLTIYNRYRWYTANDTASQPARNPTGWALYASEDNVNWILLDYVENQDPTNANYSLAYTSESLTAKRKAQRGYDLSVTFGDFFNRDHSHRLSTDNGHVLSFTGGTSVAYHDDKPIDIGTTVVFHNVKSLSCDGYNVKMYHKSPALGISQYIIFDGTVLTGTYELGIDSYIVYEEDVV